MQLRDRVTHLRAPLVADPYGNQIRDWAVAVLTTDVPAEVQPVSSTEDVVNQDRTVTRWRIFEGPASDLAYTDRVRWDGDDYEVDGDVERWKRRGSMHHVEAVLKRVELGP